MIVTTRWTAPQPSVSVAGVVLGDDAKAEQDELARARDQLSDFESRLSDTRRLLQMSRGERREKSNMQTVVDHTWNEARKFHSGIFAHLAIFGAAGLGAAAMFTGYNPLLGVIGGGVLAYAYLRVVRDLYMPFKVDSALKTALRQEEKGLEAALPQARQQVEAAQARLDGKLREALEASRPKVGIHVDEAAVTIGGVRIKVRR